MTLEESVFERRSVRTFSKNPPDRALISSVISKYENLQLVAGDNLSGKRIGSYGVIQGNPLYIAVLAGDELKAGINGEMAVLELTSLGYDSCWLGVTFNKNLVDASVNMKDDERVVAVIAVGNAAKRRSFVDMSLHMLARGGHRKDVTDLIVGGTPAYDLRDALDAVRMAPSAMNRQPWRFTFGSSGDVNVYGDPKDSFMTLDVGIAIAHFMVMRPDFDIQPLKAPYPGLKPIVTLRKRKDV